MSCATFLTRTSASKDRERYGQGTFGQYTLLARHLRKWSPVCHGGQWHALTVTFQHEIYQMLVPDLDNIIFQLITDLKDRDMLDNTLVVMMGEFAAPWLNASRGDHYPHAWSLAMAGCGIQRGGRGATDADGIEVAENPFNERNLFATIFTVLGIDPYQAYDLPGLPTFIEWKSKLIRGAARGSLKEIKLPTAAWG